MYWMDQFFFYLDSDQCKKKLNYFFLFTELYIIEIATKYYSQINLQSHRATFPLSLQFATYEQICSIPMFRAY